MVSMSDGTRLATDLYRPVPEIGAQTFPALLVRTPYNKTGILPDEGRRAREPDIQHDNAYIANFFASNGYVVAYQDVRGRGLSEGIFEKYVNEPNDGHETIEWLANLSITNGMVGTFGLSYLAGVQMGAAETAPRGLATMFLDSGGLSNAFLGGLRQNGVLELKQLTWAFSHALTSPEVLADRALEKKLKAIDLKDWFRAGKMPWLKGHNPLQWTPAYENYSLAMWQRDRFDASWQRAGIYAEGFYEDIPDIPMLQMSSWYDAYSRTVTDNYVALSQKKHAPMYLVLGPWTHGAHSFRISGDVDFGAYAQLESIETDYYTFRLRWFDRFLKNFSNGLEKEHRVRLFVMGGGRGGFTKDGHYEHGGRWRGQPSWPAKSTRYVRYYFHADGHLNTTVPPSASSISWAYDPSDPVPSVGGTITSGQPIMEGGPFNQVSSPRFFPSKPPYGPLADREDVVVFQTDPLERDIEITGNIQFHAWVISNCTDTDFTVKLVDVAPNGFALNVNEGILRARYRDQAWSEPRLMVPGQVYAIDFSTYPSSNLFKAGHRIRIDVSSSNFPHFDLNPNTGKPGGVGAGYEIANNTMLLGPVRPSYVVLPVVDASPDFEWLTPQG